MSYSFQTNELLLASVIFLSHSLRLHCLILIPPFKVMVCGSEMEVQTEQAFTPDLVANTFAQRYFTILDKSPEDLHHFYQESSSLSRPKPDGTMEIVTTKDAINAKLSSIDFQNLNFQILNVDGQSSYQGGVLVVLTGFLIEKDEMKRSFSQTFFLAPQENGYFVFNDVFRYVDEHHSVGDETAGSSDSFDDGGRTAAPIAAVIEQSPAPENAVPTKNSDVAAIEAEERETSQNVKVPITVKSGVADPSENSYKQDPLPNSEKMANQIKDDVPGKKSYLSVVRKRNCSTVGVNKQTSVTHIPTFGLQVQSLKMNSAPFLVRNSQAKPLEQLLMAVAPSAEPSVPRSNNEPEKSNNNADKAYAIFVANLPMNATVEQLERIFKEFGPIKRDGIQVRSNKQQGSCFGFVEFESATSMLSALEASQVMLDDRRLSIEERRAAGDRGRFPTGRGGYRNDNFRGRGNFVGGRGYGRNDFEKRGEFSGRSRSNAGRNGEAFPRGAYQNGGRAFRTTAVKAQ